MSIKIYNGYKINNLSISQINELSNDLRNEVNQIAKEKYVKTILCLSTEILDNITYFKDIISDENKFNKYLDYINKRTKSFEKLEKESIYGNKDKKDEIDDLKKEQLGYIVGDYLDKEIKMNEFEYLQTIYDYEYKICILENDNESMLLLAYNDELLNDLSDHIQNNDNFCKKYNLQEYIYYDNTDKPKNISQEEWDKRCYEWDKALKKGNGIPINSGITVDLFPDYKYELGTFFIFTEMKNYIEKYKDIISVKNRANRKAIEIYEDKYITEKFNKLPENEKATFRGHMKWEKEFKELLKTDTELNKNINELTNKLEEMMVDISNDTLLSSLDKIFDFGNKNIEQDIIK